MRICRGLVLTALVLELAACGNKPVYQGPNPPATGSSNANNNGSAQGQPPCECPAMWVLNPVPLKLSPDPNGATITIARNDGQGYAYAWVGPFPNTPTSRASCNSAAECNELKLGVDAGVFSITVDAPDYQSATSTVTVTRVPQACCPGLNPNSVTISLTADPN